MHRSVPFPKSHPAFKDNPLTLRYISTIEDLIELKYQTVILQNALFPIIALYDQPASELPKIPMNPDLKEALETIINMAPPRPTTQLDIDREAIWDMKHRSGSLYVLSFLEPKLALSLETLFSGVVVGYIQMFNDTEIRLRLNADKVFKNNPDLKLFFNKIIKPLRNDQYAHKASSEGQHYLSFHVDASNNIVINDNPTHFGYEFHNESCKKLYSCLAHTEKYLSEEITTQSSALTKMLTPEQIEALRSEWESPSFSNETLQTARHPLTPRDPKPEIPKRPRKAGN